MKYERNVTLEAPLDTVWSLIDELDAVAGCVSGISDFVQESPTSFRCRMTQKVGHVTTRLDLTNELIDVEPQRRVTVVSQGDDRKLRASVRTKQSFELQANGDRTDISITADVHVTGRIATFGGRIILAKTEEVVVDALKNVEQLLSERLVSPSTPGETDETGDER